MIGSVNTPGASGRERKQAEKSLLARMDSLEKALNGNKKIPGISNPTAQVAAKVGQIYINIITGEEWKCVAVTSDGSVWEKQTKSSVGLTAEQVGASPVGHKHTKSEITDFPTSMPASDVPAWAKNATKPAYTAAEVGAAPSNHNHTAADVGAAPANHSHTAADIGAAAANHTHTAADVGAAPEGHTHTASDLGITLKIFSAGKTAPTDKGLLWIDTTATTGGLKYHNGTAWVHVPVSTT